MINLSTFAKKWLPIIVLSAIAMQFLIGQDLESDKDSHAIRIFLSSNEKIIKEVGSLQDIRIIKRVDVSAASTESAYRVYTVDVRGTTSATTAIVRINGKVENESIILESLIR